MEKFRKVLEDPQKYAEAWQKKTGGKVMGYTCPYLPEELPYAAGILPVRMLAQYAPDDSSERYLPTGACPPSRNIMLHLMKGHYDYLGGMGCGEGCQWLRHTYSSWEAHGNTPYMHHVYVPIYPQGHGASDLLRGEMEVFKKSLEKWTGKTITNKAIDAAIEVYNINRRLLRQLYELRRADNPAVLGSEAMDIVLASQVMDKAEHNLLLEKFLAKLPAWGAAPSNGSSKVRIMLIGSETYDTRLEKLIESLGGNVVVDELCNGSSYFWNEVVPQKDRLMAITLRYLDKYHCAIKDNRYRRRTARIQYLAEDYNVHGAIIQMQRYCVPNGFDNPFVTDALKERQVPFHFIELQDTTFPSADLEMRLEAFIDMIRPTVATLAAAQA
jgi:benzoyl-CoA reductase subunit C